MIDVKCVIVNKVHRGQDFERLYCSKCPHREKASIEVRHGINLLDGIGKEVTITCPNLMQYQSYMPKDYGDDLSRIGKPSPISYYVLVERRHS